MGAYREGRCSPNGGQNINGARGKEKGHDNFQRHLPQGAYFHPPGLISWSFKHLPKLHHIWIPNLQHMGLWETFHTLAIISTCCQVSTIRKFAWMALAKEMGVMETCTLLIRCFKTFRVVLLLPFPFWYCTEDSHCAFSRIPEYRSYVIELLFCSQHITSKK